MLKPRQQHNTLKLFRSNMRCAPTRDGKFQMGKFIVYTTIIARESPQTNLRTICRSQFRTFNFLIIASKQAQTTGYFQSDFRALRCISIDQRKNGLEIRCGEAVIALQHINDFCSLHSHSSPNYHFRKWVYVMNICSNFAEHAHIWN